MSGVSEDYLLARDVPISDAWDLVRTWRRVSGSVRDLGPRPPLTDVRERAEDDLKKYASRLTRIARPKPMKTAIVPRPPNVTHRMTP